MPQLDKYIFFNQIIYLTFFFSLVYIYIRGTVVPKISTLLKYRKKRIYLFNEQINGYSKILKFSKSIFDKEGKILTSYLTKGVVTFYAFYQLMSFLLFITISNRLRLSLNQNKKIDYSITKNKLELQRLKTILDN